MTNPNPTLSRPTFPFAHLPLARRIAVVEQVLEKCKSSASLPAGDTFVAALSQQTQDLAQTEVAAADLKKKVAAMLATRRDKELGFRKACMAFLGHISTIAQGDPTLIKDVGLVAHTPVRHPAAALVMTQPLTLQASAGLKPGEVHLKWKKVKGARSYVIEMSRTANDGFVQVAISAARRLVLTGQPSAAPLYFRVAALGPQGPGPFSDDAAVVAR